MPNKYTPPVEYEPSPEEIEEMTAEIRKDWTPAEHRRRSGQSTFRELDRKGFRTSKRDEQAARLFLPKRRRGPRFDEES